MRRVSGNQCCWCQSESHMSQEVHVVIQTGCFRRPLARFRSYRWLEDTPPLVLFMLMASTKEEDMRHLGKLAATLVEAIHRAGYDRFNNYH
eukprot:5560199-Amphidinium_carterae.1